MFYVTKAFLHNSLSSQSPDGLLEDSKYLPEALLGVLSTPCPQTAVLPPPSPPKKKSG